MKKPIFLVLVVSMISLVGPFSGRSIEAADEKPAETTFSPEQSSDPALPLHEGEIVPPVVEVATQATEIDPAAAAQVADAQPEVPGQASSPLSAALAPSFFPEGTASGSAGAEELLKRFASDLVRNNRAIKASERNLEAGRQRFLKSKTVFYPTLTVTEGLAKTTNRSYNADSGIDEDYSTNRKGTTVGLKQRTFLGTAGVEMERSKTDYNKINTSYFSSVYFTLQRGLLQREERLMSLEKSVDRKIFRAEQIQARATVLDTLLEGFDLLFERYNAMQNLQFKQRNIDFYKTLVEEAEVKLGNGLGSELDLKQARMRLTLANTDLEESKITLGEVDRKLGLALGSDSWDAGLASFTPVDVASLVPGIIVLDRLIEKGMKERPDLAAKAFQVEAQRDSARLAREKNRPDVSTVLRWGRQGRSTEESMARDMRDKSWDVTVTFSTPLVDKAETREWRAASKVLEAQLIQLEQARQAARTAITNAERRLTFSRQNLLDLQASSRLSGEVLEGQRLNFQLGKVSLLDLMRYQSDYEETCLSVIKAQATLIMNWMRVLYETGDLGARFGIDG